MKNTKKPQALNAKEYYPEEVKKKSIPWKPVLLACFAIIGIILLVFSFYQSVYLSLHIYDKQIESIRMVSYEGEAFIGSVQKDRVLTETEDSFHFIMRQMNYNRVCLVHPKECESIAFITFSDGSSMNAYVDRNMLGLDYGKVWLYVDDLQEFLSQDDSSNN
ncbi:MAG: hypothetical protein ACC608_07695 [Anaerofustis sp.]